MQAIEIGDAVDAEDHGLAINDEVPVPDLERALDDPGIAASPVMAIAGEEAHTIPLAGHDQAVAVVFDFVQPGRG